MFFLRLEPFQKETPERRIYSLQQKAPALPKINSGDFGSALRGGCRLSPGSSGWFSSRRRFASFILRVTSKTDRSPVIDSSSASLEGLWMWGGGEVSLSKMNPLTMASLAPSPLSNAKGEGEGSLELQNRDDPCPNWKIDLDLLHKGSWKKRFPMPRDLAHS